MTRRKTPVPAIGLPEAAPTPAQQTVAVLSIPLSPRPAAGYCPRRFHLEVHLGPREADAFRALQNALDEHHARLRGGKVVQSRADVCRWLFEQIGALTHRPLTPDT